MNNSSHSSERKEALSWRLSPGYLAKGFRADDRLRSSAKRRSLGARGREDQRSVLEADKKSLGRYGSASFVPWATKVGAPRLIPSLSLHIHNHSDNRAPITATINPATPHRTSLLTAMFASGNCLFGKVRNRMHEVQRCGRCRDEMKSRVSFPRRRHLAWREAVQKLGTGRASFPVEAPRGVCDRASQGEPPESESNDFQGRRAWRFRRRARSGSWPQTRLCLCST